MSNQVNLNPVWILSYPRTGSSFLCEILNTFDSYNFDEYYKINNTDFPFFNKIQPNHIIDKNNFREKQFDLILKKLPKIKFIVLKRKDLISATISFYLARRTGVWMIKSEKELNDYVNLDEVTYDKNRLFKLFEIVSEYDKFWIELLEMYEQKYKVYYYEDLLLNLNETINSIKDYLQLNFDLDLNNLSYIKQSYLKNEYLDFKKRLKIDLINEKKLWV